VSPLLGYPIVFSLEFFSTFPKNLGTLISTKFEVSKFLSLMARSFSARALHNNQSLKNMSSTTRLPDRSILSIAGVLVWSSLIQAASAQIQPDATLGADRSIVTNQTIKTLPSQLIQGGTIRGGNLFHSFEQFNVLSGQGTYFANPTGVTNILTRVTGSNLSRLDGTLGVLGNANLFLLNPNGILFGSGAKLDLSGSFTASTAGSISLGPNGSFNAIAPNQSNLLSIKPNVYFTTAAGQTQAPLQPTQIKPIGDLTNSGNLQVNPGQTLSLYGSTVYQFGNLTASGGTVEVLGDRVGLMAGSSIDVSAPIQAGNVFVGGDLKGAGALPLAQVTYVDQNATVNANANLNAIAPGFSSNHPNGNGGQVVIWGGQTLRAYGMINAKGIGTGTGGSVETSSRGHLNVAGLKVNVQAPTIAGTWLLDPHNVILNYDYQATNPLLAGIFTPSSDDTMIYIPHIQEALDAGNNVTIETGSAGNQSGNQAGNITAMGFGMEFNNLIPVTLIFRAANDINFEGFGIEAKQAPVNFVFDAGNDITVKSGSIGTAGGSMSLTAGRSIGLMGIGFGTVSAPIVLNAKQNIFLDGAGLDAGSGSLTVIADEARSNQGQINLQGAVLKATGGITLFASEKISSVNADIKSTYDGTSEALPIRLTAKNIAIESGQVVSEPTNTGRGSDLIVNADSFSIKLAEVSTKTRGAGRSGDVFLNANQMMLENFTLESWTVGSGRGGDVTVQAKTVKLDKAGSVSTQSGVYYGSQLEVVPQATGDAGNLIFRADTIDMSGQSNLGSETRSFGNAGNILLEAKTVNVGKRSQISNFTKAQGNAGNLTIVATDSINVNNGIFTTSTEGSGQGGNLNLTTDRFNLLDGGIQASAFSSGQGGKTMIQANILNNDAGFILGLAEGSGNAGDTRITVDQLNMTNNAVISNSTDGSGNAGSITVIGKELNLLSRSIINTESSIDATGNAANINIVADRLLLENGYIGNGTYGSGNAGLLDLQVKDLVLQNRGVIASNTQGSGQGGTVMVQSDRLTLDQTSVLATRSYSSGNGGLLQLNIQDSLKLSNNSTISASSDTNATGNAGTVLVNAPKIDLFSNSRIEGSTLGAGQGGVVEINAGTVNLFDRSQLQAYTNGTGNAGSIQVKADRLGLFSQSEIISNSLKVDSGNAGMIDLNIQDLRLDQSSRIATNTSGTGKGGEIEINAQQVRLDRNSLISSYGSNVGDAGSIQVNATDSIRLSNGSRMDVRTASGQGGNLSLNAQWIELRSRSILSAEANGNGDGGNIFLTAPIVVGLGNSDIIANASKGDGGNIKIKTDALLGLKFRDRLTDGNDISASSEFGINGNVIINTPGVDATAGAVSLADDVLNTNAQISDQCATQGNQFIVTGRGGIKPSPSLQKASARSWSDLRENSANQASSNQVAAPIVTTVPSKPQFLEADQLQVDPTTGQVVLMASRSGSLELPVAVTCNK
jgi:filamentous hemagglutinin family protein